MGARNSLAVGAMRDENLLRLSTCLQQAVEECLGEGISPPTDPAVNLLCFQIAFAGNGDYPAGYYRELLQYCAINGEQEPPKPEVTLS